MAAKVGGATGRHTFVQSWHTGDQDDIGGRVEAADGEFGRVDVLVNNAGMSPLYPDQVGVTRPFYTNIAEAWDKDAVAKAFSTYPLGRGGHLHEVVGAALYLASDAFCSTTGTVLPVDGAQAIAR